MEYIEREKAKEMFYNGHTVQSLCERGANTLGEAFSIILDEVPAADVRPVVKGFNKLKDYPSLFECSVCGWECGDTVPGDTETYNFCPNCGADMREES